MKNCFRNLVKVRIIKHNIEIKINYTIRNVYIGTKVS